MKLLVYNLKHFQITISSVKGLKIRNCKNISVGINSIKTKYLYDTLFDIKMF